MKLRVLTALILIVLFLLAGCQDAAAPDQPSPNARFSHSALGSDAHAVAKLNAEITNFRSPAVRFLDDLFGIER